MIYNKTKTYEGGLHMKEITLQNKKNGMQAFFGYQVMQVGGLLLALLFVAVYQGVQLAAGGESLFPFAVFGLLDAGLDTFFDPLSQFAGLSLCCPDAAEKRQYKQNLFHFRSQFFCKYKSFAGYLPSFCLIFVVLKMNIQNYLVDDVLEITLST